MESATITNEMRELASRITAYLAGEDPHRLKNRSAQARAFELDAKKLAQLIAGTRS